MRSHETHRSAHGAETSGAETSVEIPGAETSVPDLVARVSAMDSIFPMLVARTGLVAPLVNDFTVENVVDHLPAINAARRKAIVAAIASETGGEGTKAPGKYSALSIEDKREYGRLRANGGGVLNDASGKPVLLKNKTILVDPFVWEPDSAWSLLEEAIDRVRFDWLVWAGMNSGKYEDNRTTADRAKRAPARAQIRNLLDTVPGPFKGAKASDGRVLPAKSDPLFSDKTYRELVAAKESVILTAREEPQTKNMTKTDEDPNSTGV